MLYTIVKKCTNYDDAEEVEDINEKIQAEIKGRETQEAADQK